jgi:hypothetical protein
MMMLKTHVWRAGGDDENSLVLWNNAWEATEMTVVIRMPMSKIVM